MSSIAVEAVPTPLVLPTPHDGTVSTSLAVIATQTPAVAKQTLNCTTMLEPDQLAKAKADAAKLLQDMLKNTQVFLEYGTGALAGVNALIDRLLHDVGPTEIPELKELMNGLNDGMRDVRRKWDVSQPEVRKKLESGPPGRIKRFFRKARTWLEMLIEDVTSIESQLNKTSKTLGEHQAKITRNVGFYDAIYDENELEIGKVVYAIAVMELIRQGAADLAASIPDSDNAGDRTQEEKARIAQFATNMDTKIAEYKGRLFIAWATAPQVRMMRTLNLGLAEKINELRCVTIPTMKGTLVQWRMLVQSKDAADLGQLVGATSNEWLQAYAAAGAEVVPTIAEMIQTPTLQVATITAIADSLVKQSEGMIHALELGDQRRAEVDQAILTAKQVLDDTANNVTDAIIERVVRNATQEPVVATYEHA